MKHIRFFRPLFVLALTIAMLSQATWTLAGTTGSISGSIADSTTGKPVADALVVASSPSETATAKTDASGHFAFLTLAPDTYSVSATKNGYSPVSVAGVTVFADQTQTLSLNTAPELKTIAKLTSRAAGSLVKSGTTSDVYSVNAATQKAVQGIGGGYNLDSSYSAIYSQPGVESQIGNYGFGQVFYIRGSAYSQVGYEFDGIPVNRAFDNYNANSLSSFGTQQTEVYTGGSPAGGSSATLAGYINQVIKSGTYPGFAGVNAGIGAPAFYHKLSVEAGGASPNRLFSYYAGVYGANQDYRLLNNADGGNLTPDGSNAYGISGYGFNSVVDVFSSFYTQGPWSSCSFKDGSAPANASTFAGLPACNWYSPLSVVNTANSATNIRDRETVVNLHFGLPHKYDAGRDDVQLLFDDFGYQSVYGDSLNDNGGLAYLNNGFNGWGGANGYANAIFGVSPDSYTGGTGPYANTCAFQAVFAAFGYGYTCASGPTYLPYNDTMIFAGGTTFGQDASTAKAVPYYQPGSNLNRLPNSYVPADLRDALWNNGSVVKVQYQKNFSSSAYARVMGYTFYSDWLQTSPNSAGAGLTAWLPGAVGAGNPSPDYELSTHSRGVTAILGDQIGAHNLLTLTANYTTGTAARMNNQFYAAPSRVTNLTNGDPNNPICYDYRTGAPASCLSKYSEGTYTDPTRAGYCSANSCAPAPAGAKWLVTVPAGYGPYNTVKPLFTDVALQDEFRPNDKLVLNLGARFERYQYDMADTTAPEFAFWFNAAANSYCYDPDTQQPLLQNLPPGTPPSQAGPVVAPNTGAGESAGLCYLSNGNPWTNAAGHQYRHPNGQDGSVKFTNVGVPTIAYDMWSPRVGGTYTMNPDTVLRFSLGRYTQPTETAFMQYSNLSGYGAAKFDFSHFFGLGFYTPVHANPVQVSNNVDFSVERQIHGTDIALKLSPFYRYTTNQLVTVPLSTNFVGGLNAGTQKTMGVEFALQKGDPNKNGFAGQLSYTYTNAKIKYSTLANGTNAIDALNSYIVAYNQLTSFCKSNPTDARCGNMSAAAAANVSPCYANSADNTAADCSDTTSIANPYYNGSVQSLLDRNGWYQTYSNAAPSAAGNDGAGAFGPNEFAGWLNFKHDKLAVTLTAQLNEGALYGAPTAIIGLDPRYCASNQAGSGVVASTSPYAQDADYQSCSASSLTGNGYLAIPNPETGKFDSMGQYREPWLLNLGGQLSYEISPRVNATLTLSNLMNRCFGGNGGSWTKAYKPNQYDCGWIGNYGSYIGTQPGAGFFYGASGADPANGTAGYPKLFDQAYAPVWGALPFQAYLQVQIKL